MAKTKKRKAKIKLVEIARSFSLKVNLGNYEMADFFASQKAECSPKDQEKISDALYQFVKAQVIKDVNAFKAEMRGEKEPIKVEPKKNDMTNFYEKKDKKEGIRDEVMIDAAEDSVSDGMDGKGEY